MGYIGGAAIVRKAAANGKLSEADFVLKAIENLRDPSKSTGIHSKFSGFNEAFREYFGGADPVEATARLQAEKVIVIQPRRGGVMLYKTGEEPKAGPNPQAVKRTLAAMGV